MKKYLYTLLAIVGMLVTSCSNEEIGIEVTYPKQDINLSIATSEAYENFGISDYERILGKYPNTYIGVISLLYDSEGNIVDEENTYLRQFSSVNQKFSVDRGKYTILTVMTFVDKQNYTYGSPYWNIVNKNKLSTVSLEKTQKANITWDCIVSVASQEINIVNEDFDITVTPKAIGSLVNIYHYNFDKKNDVGLVLAAKNVSSGIYLNPSLKGKDRYFYKGELNDEGHADILWIFYDEKSHTLPEEDVQTMYLLEEGTLPIHFGCTSSEYYTEEGISWWQYPTLYENFNAGEFYKAAFYYVGGETDQSQSYFDYYFGTGEGYSEWYNNAKAAYEENLKNNGGNGNTTTGPWQSIGTGTYTEAFVAPLYGLEPVTYDVEIMEHVDSAGLYRIMNPYSNNVYPYADNDCAAEGNYLLINACDPNGVFIPEQSLGFDWGYGEMSFVSEGARYLSEYDFETVKSAGLLGKVEYDNYDWPLVITLPNIPRELSDGSIDYYQGIMYVGKDVYYSGIKDGFRVTLPPRATGKGPFFVKSHFVKHLEKTMHFNNATPKMTQPRTKTKIESRKQLQLDVTRKIVD